MAYIFTLLMFRKPNKTTINKNKTTNLYRSTSFRFSFIFRYFKVFQVSQIFTCGLSDLLLLAVGNKYQHLFKKSNIQDRIQVFQIWHNLCSELTSMWTFIMYSRNTKTTNEPTASNNKSDRPQVKIWDTWKTLKYLNINENRKDVDRYKFVVLFYIINVHILVSSEHKLCQIWNTCILACILLFLNKCWYLFLQSLLSRVKYTNHSV
jgi:hypothetical protein